MAKAPQQGWANCFMVFSVTVTLFLTIKTLIQNIFGWIVDNAYMSENNFEIMTFSIGACGAVFTIGSLCLFTTFGKDLKRSFTSKREEVNLNI